MAWIRIMRDGWQVYQESRIFDPAVPRAGKVHGCLLAGRPLQFSAIERPSACRLEFDCQTGCRPALEALLVPLQIMQS